VEGSSISRTISISDSFLTANLSPNNREECKIARVMSFLNSLSWRHIKCREATKARIVVLEESQLVGLALGMLHDFEF
jgi:hypothetical protein